MVSLENAMPLGSSRGMVAPGLAVQAAPPKHVLCSREAQSHGGLYVVQGRSLQWLPALL